MNDSGVKIEVHLIQNFAPSNLNRDDTGQPKSATFGGFRRARISSQCGKRAARVAVGRCVGPVYPEACRRSGMIRLTAV